MAKVKPLAPFDEYLTVAGAAKVLSIGERGILQAIRKKTLPAIKLSRVYLISKSDVEKYDRTRRLGRPPIKPAGKSKKAG